MGEKPRLTINAREAVDLIRSGESDEELMKRYDISARSLERLFRKLVDSREILQLELDQRMLRSPRSHVVSVVSFGATGPRRKRKRVKVNASEVVRSIRSRMSDIELMEKYNLSARGINRLFNRLVERGDIEQSELDARAMALRWGEVAFVRSEGRNPEPIDDRDDEVPSGRARFEEFVENHKVILAAVLGAIAGIVFTVTSMTVVIGPKRALELIGLRPEKAEAAATLQDPLNVLAEQIIAILESLARGDPGSLSSSDRVRSSRYEECLRDCDNQYSGSDDFDQAVRVDCRKKCVVLYSERMRKIRELYHGSGLRP